MYISKYSPVEEDEGLFSEDDEDGVTKLRNLAQGEHPVPEPAHSVVQETANQIVIISKKIIRKKINYKKITRKKINYKKIIRKRVQIIIKSSTIEALYN